MSESSSFLKLEFECSFDEKNVWILVHLLARHYVGVKIVNDNEVEGFCL